MGEELKQAQDVGKKLTGFFGDLAEKAKNIDVKELTERAKQKVGEVKDIATEINCGKTENFAQPREDVSAEQMKELLQKMSAQMMEALPAVVEAELHDLTFGEQVVYKLKSGTTSEPAYLVLTGASLMAFSKTGEQFSASVYPFSTIRSYTIIPPRGETAGRFIVSTKSGEIRIVLGSLEMYCKSLLLYKKMRELSNRD